MFSAPKSLTGLHLFYHPYSNCSQRVMLLLAEKGAGYCGHVVNLMRSEQLSDGYRGINPKAEVPAIVDDGKVIIDSCAILQYLNHHLPGANLLPEDSAVRARVERLLRAAAVSHESQVVEYVYAHGYGCLPTPADWQVYRRHVPHRAEFHRLRRAGKAGCDTAHVERVLLQQFAEFDFWLGQYPYLAGHDYSLADIAWFPNTIILRQLGYSFRAFSHVRAWIERIEARPAYQTGIEANFLPLPNAVIRWSLKGLRLVGNRN